MLKTIAVVGIAIAAQAAFAQQASQNNRSSQFQIGGGKLVLEALERGHPACYQRLVNSYQLPTQVLVSRDGTLHDNGKSKVAATEAFICALALSDLIATVKNEMMGLPARSAQQVLAGLFNGRLGQQSKKTWSSIGEHLKISVNQSDGYKRPYIVEYGPINQQILTIKVGKDAPDLIDQLPGQIDGGKLDSERQEFTYYATGRINAFSATYKDFLVNYREGAFKVAMGGRPYFDLSADIIGGQKITIDDTGSMSFDVVR